MKKYFKNNLGFTLAEVMIAAGLAGLVALVAYTTLRSSQSVVGNSLASAEVTFLKNQLITNLAIPENCERNFVGKLVNSPAAPATPPFSSIAFLEKRTRVSAPPAPDSFSFTLAKLLEAGQYYGEGTNKALLVKNIYTRESPVNPNSMILTVDYELKSSLQKQGGNNLSFSVEVFIAKQGTGPTSTVRSCASDVFTMIRNAIAFSCKGNGATYNAAAGTYGTCTHNTIRVLDESSATVANPNGLCPTGQFLFAENTVDGVDGVANSSGRTTYKCKTYTTISDQDGTSALCPANFFVKSIKADGQAECVSLNTLYAATPIADGYVITPLANGVYQQITFSCPATQVLRKINADGSANCVPKQIIGSCPANQYIIGINNDGSPKCGAYPKISGACPAGQYVRSVGSDGSISSCGPPTLPLSGGCTGDNVINYIYGDGSVYCLPNN